MNRRAPLTRARLLSTAIEIADEHGLGALTIRALADRLGVKPMALYHHVANKDEILDGIVDHVFAQIELPHVGRPWRAEITRRTHAARRVLVTHPWSIGLLESRRSPGVATLQHHDAVLGTLLADGFSAHAAAHAYALLDSYLYGFVVQEAALPFAPAESEQVATEMLAAYREQFPHLARIAAELIGPDYDFSNEFEVGLTVVLDGIQQLRDDG